MNSKCWKCGRPLLKADGTIICLFCGVELGTGRKLINRLYTKYKVAHTKDLCNGINPAKIEGIVSAFIRAKYNIPDIKRTHRKHASGADVNRTYVQKVSSFTDEQIEEWHMIYSKIVDILKSSLNK